MVIGLAERIDLRTLAYLWIAIEYDYNILILGRQKPARELVEGLSLFIPRYRTALDITRDNRAIGRINFSKATNAGRLGRAGVEMAIEAAKPDRLIAANARFLGMLFAYPKFGISFMGSIEGCDPSRGIVRALLARPYRISRSDINSLDISIVLDSAGISSITEYRWLEKAETSILEGRILAKNYRNAAIFRWGAPNPEQIGLSKVIESYAKSNLISVGYASNELDRRAEYLRRIGTGKQVLDPIERYYEIA